MPLAKLRRETVVKTGVGDGVVPFAPTHPTSARLGSSRGSEQANPTNSPHLQETSPAHGLQYGMELDPVGRSNHELYLSRLTETWSKVYLDVLPL